MCACCGHCVVATQEANCEHLVRRRCIMSHHEAGNRLLDMALEDGAPRAPLSGLFPASLAVSTLEDALVPVSATLPHLHPSTGRSVKLARRQAKRAQAKHPSLALDKCAAIVLYTMEEIPRENSLYYALNLALRNQSRDAVRPWRNYVWLLLHALRELPPSTEMTVFRGCRKSPGDLGLELCAGFDFTWASFSSTATTQGVMQTFVGQSGPRTLLTIQMAERIGRDVRDFSLHPCENEILFPPNMCFEVVDSFDAGNQLIMVQCRQTETIDALLEFDSAEHAVDVSEPSGQPTTPLAVPASVGPSTLPSEAEQLAWAIEQSKMLEPRTEAPKPNAPAIPTADVQAFWRKVGSSAGQAKGATKLKWAYKRIDANDAKIMAHLLSSGGMVHVKELMYAAQTTPLRAHFPYCRQHPLTL